MMVLTFGGMPRALITQAKLRPRSDVFGERMESKTYRHRDFYDKFKSGT